jgi:hypothetical protein
VKYYCVVCLSTSMWWCRLSGWDDVIVGDGHQFSISVNRTNVFENHKLFLESRILFFARLYINKKVSPKIVSFWECLEFDEENLTMIISGRLGCIWFDGYPLMGDGGLWTNCFWFAHELDMDIIDKRIFSQLLDIPVTKNFLSELIQVF